MKTKHAENKHLRRAIDDYYGGNQAAYARDINVSPQFVTKMLLHGKSVPPKKATLTEQLTNGGVTRKQLRPDDWRQLWPELR